MSMETITPEGFYLDLKEDVERSQRDDPDNKYLPFNIEFLNFYQRALKDYESTTIWVDNNRVDKTVIKRNDGFLDAEIAR